jgi:hypothetical protein
MRGMIDWHAGRYKLTAKLELTMTPQVGPLSPQCVLQPPLFAQR